MPIYQNNNTLDRIEEDIIDLNFILQPRWTTQRRLAINSGNTSRPTESENNAKYLWKFESCVDLILKFRMSLTGSNSGCLLF